MVVSYGLSLPGRNPGSSEPSHDEFDGFFAAGAILMVHEGAEDLFAEAVGAVADGGEILMADPVEDGEAMAHEWNIFVAGDVFTVGSTDN